MVLVPLAWERPRAWDLSLFHSLIFVTGGIHSVAGHESTVDLCDQMAKATVSPCPLSRVETPADRQLEEQPGKHSQECVIREHSP